MLETSETAAFAYDPAAGSYHIAAASGVTHNRATVECDNGVRIRTEEALWSYAYQIELPEAAQAAPFTLEIAVQIQEGLAGLCIVNAQGEVLREVCVAPGEAHIVETGIVEGEAHLLIVRNASPEGATTLVIDAIELFPGRTPYIPPEPDPENMRRFGAWVGTVHEGASAEGADTVHVTTPDVCWSYAFTIDLPESARPAPCTISAAVEVLEGKAGLVVVDVDGNLLAEIDIAPGDPSPVTIGVPHGEPARLVIRNASPSGAASMRLHDLRLEPGVLPPLPEIQVDPSVFKRFGTWSGVTPAGFWTDWLGTRTRAEVWDFEPEVRATYARERFEKPNLPLLNEHVLDWAPLLAAVETSGERFVMFSLGSGWGRWIVAGAMAAVKTGRTYHILGVEAEPTHYEWLLRHFADNGIDPERATAIRAAASDKSGLAWFQTGSATNWYGQSIVSDSDIPEAPADAPLWSEVDVGEFRLQRVRSVALRELAEPFDVIDYVHMDIQGSEADFLEAHPDVLDAKVRVVNVGTHSTDIQRRLRRLFGVRGWRNSYDISLHSAASVRVGDRKPFTVDFGDGVQVWENPRFS